MERIYEILLKYAEISILFEIDEIKLNESLIKYSEDLIELVDALSRVNNCEARPDFYSLNESTIVGLMTRIVKLYKEIIINYKQNKMEILTLFTRPLYESFVILKYLIKNGELSQRNFRVISYKARFENMKTLEKLSNAKHPSIERQIWKFNSKLEEDGFTIRDLEEENSKKGKWKLDSKSFKEIHGEVETPETYSFVYGLGSDAVHGSWQEILDFHLYRKESGYVGFLNYEKCDVRILCHINPIMFESIMEFLVWNSCSNPGIELGLKNMIRINNLFYEIWEKDFGEKIDSREIISL